MVYTTVNGLPAPEADDPLGHLYQTVADLAEALDPVARAGTVTKATNPATVGAFAASIPNATWTDLRWRDTLLDSPAVLNDFGATPPGFYVQVDGVWKVTAQFTYGSNATGTRALRLVGVQGLSGVQAYASVSGAATLGATVRCEGLIPMTAGQGLVVATQQTSGAALAPQSYDPAYNYVTFEWKGRL